VTARPFLVIAHRGASSSAPENTRAAFDRALALGARHLELDVHTTADGHVVVIHDAAVDRTTDGTGAVASHTLARLRSLDAGSWFGPAFAGERIPTLEETLARYAGRAHLHVEIKGHALDLTRRTVDLIRQHRMERDVTITSFARARLEEVRACGLDVPLGWLVPEATEAVMAEAGELGVVQLCPEASTVTAALVSRLHGAGLLVRAWGVGTEPLMERVVDAGADGMTVNFPERLIAYLTSRGLAWA
jgi:glycerophosphoryl diester phosphodiesterase